MADNAANDQRFEAIRRMLCKGSADDRVLSGSEYDDMPWGEALGLLWAIEQDLSAARESLAMLRSAWNKHMETCPQHAALPTPEPPSWEDLQAWRDAPSGTASA